MPVEFKRHVLHHENPFMFIDGDKETVKYVEKEFDPTNIEHQKYLKETTDLLTRYIQDKMPIEVGHPAFGAVLIDSDVVIYVKISNDEFRRRMELRNSNTHRLIQPESHGYKKYVGRRFRKSEIGRKNHWRIGSLLTIISNSIFYETEEKIIFLDGDGTLWYPKATKRTQKPHWIYHDPETKDNYLEHLELTPKTKEALEYLSGKACISWYFRRTHTRRILLSKR